MNPAAIIIIFLTYCVICGFVTARLSKSKGYDNGFLWGLFLGIIGIFIIVSRPNLREIQFRALDSQPKWKCDCGTMNSNAFLYCIKCNKARSKCQHDTPKLTCPHCGAFNNATNSNCFVCSKPLTVSTPQPQTTSPNTSPHLPNEPPDYFVALEKLSALHRKGILTDEEYQQKKADILDKI